MLKIDLPQLCDHNAATKGFMVHDFRPVLIRATDAVCTCLTNCEGEHTIAGLSNPWKRIVLYGIELH